MATSTDSDDPLAIYGSQLGIKVFRGSEDVMQRFSDVLSQYNCDAFFKYVEIVRYYNRSYLKAKFILLIILI